MIEDAYDFNMVQEIIQQFVRVIGDEEDKVLIQGSGTGQPTGLTNCTITTIACAGNLDFDDIYNLVYSLPARYRQSNKASFLVNTNNVREMRKLKDTNGRYLWQEPLSVDQPVTFNGFRLYENSYVPESKTEVVFRSLKILSDQFGKVWRQITHNKQALAVQLQRLSERTLQWSEATVRSSAII